MSLTWPRIESTVRTRTYMMSKLVTSASPAANGGTLGSYQRWEPQCLQSPQSFQNPRRPQKGEPLEEARQSVKTEGRVTSEQLS